MKFLIFVTVTLSSLISHARSGVYVGVYCERKMYCKNNEPCVAKFKYWTDSSLISQNFRFHPEDKVSINLLESTQEIVLTTADKSIPIAKVDLNELNCAEEESDRKYFRLNIPKELNPALKVLETSMCQHVWDGTKWTAVKNEKYGIYFNDVLMFSTPTSMVTCD